MAFLDRLHKIAVAAGGATKAVLGFTLGLPAASFKDDEYDSFVGDIYGNIVASGKDIMAATLGPQGVGGEVLGAVPEPIRHPVRTVTEPILSGLETGYREAIAEPISTFFTTIAIADEYGKFSPSQAYRIAQHRSPGQALAVAFDGTNPLDEAEVAKFLATDKGRMVSGMSDAVLRIGADPTVIAGKAAKAIRVAKVVKPLDTPEKILAAVNSPKTAQFSESILAFKAKNPKAAAAEIRDRFFPDHEAGSLIATIYGEAKTARDVHLATRALLGDPEALALIRADRSVIHESIASLNRQADQLGPIKAMKESKYEGTVIDPLHMRGTVGDGGTQMTLFGVDANGIPNDVAALRDELTQYYAWDQRLSRMQKGYGAIKTAPRARLIDKVPAIGELRHNITRSDFYQKSTLGRGLETIFHMNSHPVMNLSDARSDINIHRMMQEGGLPQDLQDTFRTEYMAAPDDATRLKVALSAEKTTIAHLAAQAKMTPEELTNILSDMYAARGQAQEMLKSRIFNDDGSSVLTHQDVNGHWVETFFPASVTQEATLLPLVNMRELRSATEWFGGLRAHNPAMNVPREAAEWFNRIWKPAVLLRPAWPIRVVGDEQFRIIAKIGALSHLDNLHTGLKDYRTDFISSVRTRGVKGTIGRENRSIRQSFAVREYSTHGLDMEGVFGTPDDVRSYTRSLVSSERSWQGLVGDIERHELREFRMAGENFKSVNPDDADYPQLYNWAVDHLATQPIAKRLLAGESAEDVITWLHSTPEGSDLLRANTLKSHNARNWVEEIEREIDRYTASNPELLDIFAGRDPRVRQSTPIIPPAAPSLPPLYHGTPKSITKPMQYGGRASQNLFGPGFYTTDNPAVAEQYFRKGKRPEDKPIMYSAQYDKDPVVVDMTQPLPENLRQPVREYMEGTIAHLEYNPTDFDKLVQLLDEHAPGEVLYAQYKKTLASLDPPITGGTADDYLTDLNDLFLEQGVDAFKYKGGIRTGNEKHNAYVFLRPEGISIAEVPKLKKPEGPYEFANLTPYEQLTRLVPDIHLRPVAHGEALRQATNTGYTMRRIGEIVERTFDKLGRLPTDVFSRNPFMGHMYRAEIDRQLTILGDTPIDNVLKAEIEQRARDFALNETEKLLYNLAESSRFGEMLSFLSPFYNAWQEVITRWTGLAIENPVFAARARLIWRAPEKMGLVTDEHGNEVKSGQVYSDDETAPNYRGKDRILHIPLPEWVQDIPGMKRALGPKNEIAFNKKSFNLVLQGFPSAGPIAAIPVNLIVRDRPELADNAFVEKMLPFGPTHDTLDMILPSSAKYFLSAADQDEKYANTLMRIYTDRIVEWELGGRQSPRPTYESAKKEADAFTLLRGISAMVAPAAPIWQSPYQFQIDSFRQAQARYGQWLSRRQQGFDEPNPLSDEHGNDRTPDEWFLDTHGKEYFALTQAVSRTMNGVPPTLEAWNASKEHADLIREFPELGGLIVGAEGGGTFNSAVYNAQKNTPLAPGSGKNQRENIPWDEASIDPERRLGWIEYRRFMDLIEAERIQRGLPNLQVKAAKDLAEMKAMFTDSLKMEYPAWADDFNQTDKGKWEKKIAALSTIASHPSMKDRPDMIGIRDYMEARSLMVATLEERGARKNGSKTLSASSNADLKETWDMMTGLLIAENLPFADVFYRHLENDPLGL